MSSGKQCLAIDLHDQKGWQQTFCAFTGRALFHNSQILIHQKSDLHQTKFDTYYVRLIFHIPFASTDFKCRLIRLCPFT